MIPTNDFLLIFSAISTLILGLWSSFQQLKLKELEYKYNNLCDECAHEFTPIKKKDIQTSIKSI